MSGTGGNEGAAVNSSFDGGEAYAKSAESNAETEESAEKELYADASEQELYTNSEHPNEAEQELIENSHESYELTPEQIDALTTQEGKSVFWSGLGEKGAEIAQTIAEQRGCTTLEKTLAEKSVDLPEFDPTDTRTVEAWRTVSKTYAQKASGDVRVVLGDSIRADSTFATIEYPTLIENEKVTRITAVNPKDNSEVVLADKSRPGNNKKMVSYTADGGETYVKFE